MLVGHHLVDDESESEQDDWVDADGLLDGALLSMFLKLLTHEQQDRVLAQGLFALSQEERNKIAHALIQEYNKVTHIYELVKASGSTNQVIYDRTEKVWHRRENIAEKHHKEISVNPFNSVRSLGDVHAPLIYVQDPRSDVPEELQDHLLYSIAGCDDLIVSGWLQDSHQPSSSEHDVHFVSDELYDEVESSD